ncbi:chloride channel protein [Woodsholea maritima]|uniref:chloride channel protein n=1 Tax=Woodsholea maritima TaxID=240237 RepID=UPI00036A612F|nr:chloride channel protein [Woodsholea maritima]
MITRPALRTLTHWLMPLITMMGKGRSPILWLMGIVAGLVAGYAALGLRFVITRIQAQMYGAEDEHLSSALVSLSPWHVIIGPILGGCLVAFLLWMGERTRWLIETRAEAVADVIEARAAKGAHMPLGAGLLSALISAISLGAGASTGREGPAVHLGATLASQIAHGLKLPPRAARIILASGAAAAVAASFNAPVAGALFAFEVILGHYALRSIAPVAVASVTGALIARLHYGATPAFAVPALAQVSIVDFLWIPPLGLAAACVAIAFTHLALHVPRLTVERMRQFDLPLWLLPPFGGLILGLIFLIRPEVAGIGYEATAAALMGDYGMGMALLLVGFKILATVISMGARFGGGVFGPSLYLGALLGAAFGAAAMYATSGQSDEIAFFAVVGMGAVSGAVLGAPLSTTLIVFELTGSYEASIALLVAVSLATVLTLSFTRGSFFHKQIQRHGYDLTQGAARLILHTLRARDIMSPLDPQDFHLDAGETYVFEDDTLGRVIDFLREHGLDGVPVRARRKDQPITGFISTAHAHGVYAQELMNIHEEEHR